MNSSASAYSDTHNMNCPPLLFVLEFRGESEWAKVEYPYEHLNLQRKAHSEKVMFFSTQIKNVHCFTAESMFPSLITSVYSVTDENGAKLGKEFLAEYIQFSPRGVLIKIKNDVLDICKVFCLFCTRFNTDTTRLILKY